MPLQQKRLSGEDAVYAGQVYELHLPERHLRVPATHLPDLGVRSRIPGARWLLSTLCGGRSAERVQLGWDCVPEQRDVGHGAVSQLPVQWWNHPVCPDALSGGQVPSERGAETAAGRMLPTVRGDGGHVHRLRRSSLPYLRWQVLQLPGQLQVPPGVRLYGQNLPHPADERGTRHTACQLGQNGDPKSAKLESQSRPANAGQGEWNQGNVALLRCSRWPERDDWALGRRRSGDAEIGNGLDPGVEWSWLPAGFGAGEIQEKTVWSMWQLQRQFAGRSHGEGWTEPRGRRGLALCQFLEGGWPQVLFPQAWIPGCHAHLRQAQIELLLPPTECSRALRRVQRATESGELQGRLPDGRVWVSIGRLSLRQLCGVRPRVPATRSPVAGLEERYQLPRRLASQCHVVQLQGQPVLRWSQLQPNEGSATEEPPAATAAAAGAAAAEQTGPKGAAQAGWPQPAGQAGPQRSGQGSAAEGVHPEACAQQFPLSACAGSHAAAPPLS